MWSALFTGHFYPQEIALVFTAIRTWVGLRARVRPDGLCQYKIPITPSEIKLTTSDVLCSASTNCATVCHLQLRRSSEYYLFLCLRVYLK